MRRDPNLGSYGIEPEEPCPRCGSMDCADPDSKACSDNCIMAHQQEIAALRGEVADPRLAEIIDTLARLARTQRNMAVPLTEQEHTDLRDAAALLSKPGAVECEPQNIDRIRFDLEYRLKEEQECAEALRGEVERLTKERDAYKRGMDDNAVALDKMADMATNRGLRADAAEARAAGLEQQLAELRADALSAENERKLREEWQRRAEGAEVLTNAARKDRDVYALHASIADEQRDAAITRADNQGETEQAHRDIDVMIKQLDDSREETRQAEARAASLELVKEALGRQLAERQATIYDADNKAVGVWVWVGDGEDHPESLTCPILISAEKMRALIERAATARREAGAVRKLEQWLTEADDPHCTDGWAGGYQKAVGHMKAILASAE